MLLGLGSPHATVNICLLTAWLVSEQRQHHKSGTGYHTFGSTLVTTEYMDIPDANGSVQFSTDEHRAARSSTQYTDQHGSRFSTDQHGSTRINTDQYGSTRINKIA
eukprot:gene7962-biopygen21104